MTSPFHHHLSQQTRRYFLGAASGGIGAVASRGSWETKRLAIGRTNPFGSPIFLRKRNM